MFEFIETVQFNELSYFTLFRINGELYRIWHYDNTDVKYLQKIVDDGEDIIELGEFK